MSADTSSEKKFGLLFSFIFLLVAAYPIIDGATPLLWAAAISVLFAAATLLFPRLLIVPNRAWINLGTAMGAVVAPIVIGLVYLFTIIPVGVFMKLSGRDLINKKMDSKIESYWIDRKQPIESMEEQF